MAVCLTEDCPYNYWENKTQFTGDNSIGISLKQKPFVSEQLFNIIGCLFILLSISNLWFKHLDPSWRERLQGFYSDKENRTQNMVLLVQFMY